MMFVRPKINWSTISHQQIYTLLQSTYNKDKVQLNLSLLMKLRMKMK